MTYKPLGSHRSYSGWWLGSECVMGNHRDKLVDRRIDQPAAKVEPEMTAANCPFHFGANKPGRLCSHIPPEFRKTHIRGTSIHTLPQTASALSRDLAGDLLNDMGVAPWK